MQETLKNRLRISVKTAVPYASSCSSPTHWLDMLQAHNKTAHIYAAHTAAVIADKIQNAYLPELQKLASCCEK